MLISQINSIYIPLPSSRNLLRTFRPPQLSDYHTLFLKQLCLVLDRQLRG